SWTQSIRGDARPGTGWQQRCYRLVQNHVQAGGTLPTADGNVVVQGESPSDTSYHCTYAATWVATKLRWKLSGRQGTGRTGKARRRLLQHRREVRGRRLTGSSASTPAGGGLRPRHPRGALW
ncbi:hypothetical protein ACWGPC_56690, partial [Streptomyces mirabilis]